MNNWDRVNKGFDTLLRALVKYEVHELAAHYGMQSWWNEGILPILSPEQARNVANAASDEERILSLDVAIVLSIIDRRWGDVFRRRLPRDCRTWAIELKGVRNAFAHRGVQDMNDDDAYRALDTMQRFCTELDSEKAEPIRALMREVRYGSDRGSAAAVVKAGDTVASSTSVASLAAENLPSWRSVMTPHADVAAGRYRKAEFAADLNQVVRGTATAEYSDPVEFFSRTYMTGGIKGLLTQALRRVSGQDGEPVIQLKTAFGGGKTHSMLALYHLLRGGFDIEQLPNVAEVVHGAGLDVAPRVHVAVIVGTALNPAKGYRPQNMPGITVNTIWGEIAYQLALSAGRPELYDYVKDADKKHVSPGSEALTRLFDDCGPCLVLLDEFVAYAKLFKGVDGLAAGTFDNLISFVQALTEAAKASKNSLVVASIPESEREIGGDAGQEALEAIEHTFGRVESIWKPVTADEGFSVVSRRLFSSTVDEGRRDEVCRAFFEMYRQNPNEFPVETRDPAYLERMKSCYPVHPEVYDRLYDDWASIDGFQRTRGVLRFMAAVIHDLWAEGDEGPLIMVGSIPLHVSPVRDELTRYLPEQWGPVIDTEVDGKNSEPVKADLANPRYNKVFASRRVARAIFMGSAPDAEGQSARGVELAGIKLGVVRPGDNIPVFTDALMQLRNKASYLYSDTSGNRYWYDTRPTLRKTAEQRSLGYNNDEARFELEKILKHMQKPAGLSSMHVCPSTSLDVPDDTGMKLVVLGTENSAVQGEGPALEAAKDLLANRGQAPRMYKNQVVFLAAEEAKLASLYSDMKMLMAWRSIDQDAETLDLPRSQVREVQRTIQASSEVVQQRLYDAYCMLLVPYVEIASGSLETRWESIKLGGGSGTPAERALARLRSDELVVDHWSPMLLKMELDRYLWKDKEHVTVDGLWKQLCAYCYLPRLMSFDVLEGAIRQGMDSSEFFGIADGAPSQEDGSYVNLSLGAARAFINKSDVLVRPEVARAQIEADERAADFGSVAEAASEVASIPPATLPVGTGGSGGSTASAGDVSFPEAVVPPAQPASKSFRLDASIDSANVYRQMRQIMEEVVQQLEGEGGTEISIELSVVAYNQAGFSVPVKRAVSENCSSLGISDFEFDL